MSSEQLEEIVRLTLLHLDSFPNIVMQLVVTYLLSCAIFMAFLWITGAE